MPYQIPVPNRLSDQLHATGTTIDLLRFDENLFSNLTLPDGLDRDLVIDTIIEKHGMTALMHPSPDWMKHFIGVWSKRRVLGWGKLLATTEVEYNPIENYDRKEDITETRTTNRETSNSLTSSGSTTDESTHTANSENKHDVSAENATDYQADSKDTGSGTVTDSGRQDLNTESTNTGTDETTDNFTHTNRTHGNIGVTTTQQMLQSERELVRYSLAEEIAEDYRDAFCLGIY